MSALTSATPQTATPQTAPLVRPAPEPGTLAHPSMREPEARYEAFTYYLRERARISGPQTLAGVTGRAWACPIAVWLLHGDVRGGWTDGRMGVYRWVIVRAGDTTTGPQTGLAAGAAWPHGRRATYQAFNRQGAKLGLGLCDAQLTAALDWLDGAFPLHTSVTVGECLSALAAMEAAQ